MNKGELIEAVANATSSTKADAGRAIDATLMQLRVIKEGDTVTLIGFGTFKVSKRAAEQAVTHKQALELKIPARNAPSFKAGAALKAAVN